MAHWILIIQGCFGKKASLDISHSLLASGHAMVQGSRRLMLHRSIKFGMLRPPLRGLTRMR